MPKKYLIGGSILVVLVAAIILISRNSGTPANLPPVMPALNSNPAVVTTEPADATSNSVQTFVISYDLNGFNPANITVPKGSTVTFKNLSSSDFWPASGMHPTHTTYSGTTLKEHCPDNAGVAFDACGKIPPGSSWSFKFEKTGSWGYHDHLNASRFGKVIVQ